MQSLQVPNERRVNTHNPLDPRQYDHYLAGPMSGYEDFNYPAFNQVTIMLRQNGFVIRSPHEVSWHPDHAGMEESALWEYMMAQTKKVMKLCNSIILLPGWADSRGAKRELKFAMNHDFKVFTLTRRTLAGWNKEWVNEINWQG